MTQQTDPKNSGWQRPDIVVVVVWFGLWGLQINHQISEQAATVGSVTLFTGYFCGFLRNWRGES